MTRSIKIDKGGRHHCLTNLVYLLLDFCSKYANNPEYTYLEVTNNIFL